MLHCNRPWICNNPYLLQHPLLPFCWSKYLPGHEDTHHTPLHDTDVLEPSLNLFLGIHSCPLYCTLLVQLSPVCLLVDYRYTYHFLVINIFPYLATCREFLRWMYWGKSYSHDNSWIGYCHLSRTMIMGYKKKKLGHPSEKLPVTFPTLAGEQSSGRKSSSIFLAALFVIAYMFVKSFPDSNGKYLSSRWSASWSFPLDLLFGMPPYCWLFSSSCCSWALGSLTPCFLNLDPSLPLLPASLPSLNSW